MFPVMSFLKEIQIKSNNEREYTQKESDNSYFLCNKDTNEER